MADDCIALNLCPAAVDYSSVECLQRKRLLAFFNHFVSRTAQFLNHFSRECEEKLSDVSTRLQHLENSLTLLESKLGSLPMLSSRGDGVCVTGVPG